MENADKLIQSHGCPVCVSPCLGAAVALLMQGVSFSRKAPVLSVTWRRASSCHGSLESTPELIRAIFKIVIMAIKVIDIGVIVMVFIIVTIMEITIVITMIIQGK